MKIIRSYSLNAKLDASVVTIGNFDGVHRGHKALIQQARNKASFMGLNVVCMCFEPLPSEFFAKKESKFERVCSFRDKVNWLRECGVDILVVVPFNRRTSSTPADEFILNIIKGKLNAKHVVIGDDFRFGKGRVGDFSLLEQLGREQGFTVQALSTVRCEGQQRISSSAIRAKLSEGALSDVNDILGHTFKISGHIGHGLKLGRELGVPTANISYPRYTLSVRGVYVSTLKCDGKEWPAVTSIGSRPTIGGGLKPLIETHILDANVALYGKIATIELKQHIRPEEKYTDLDALKTQIMKDIENAREYFDKPR